MQSTYTSKKGYPYTSKRGYPILQKAKDNNININIDRLFDYIINRECETSEEFKTKNEIEEFYKIIERLEFNYTKESIKIINNENVEKLKIMIYCIKEIFRSNKKDLILRATRENLIDVYDNCKEFEKLYKNTEKEINNFFDYYYTSVIKRLEK